MSTPPGANPILPAPPLAAPPATPPPSTASGSSDPSVAERILMKDYESTLPFVDKLDGQLLAIRNLAVVSASAVIAYSVSEGLPWLLWANLAVIPAFMLMELVYKSFHEDGIRRTFVLEAQMLEAIRHQRYPTDYEFGIGHAIKPLSVTRMAKLALDRPRWHMLADQPGPSRLFARIPGSHPPVRRGEARRAGQR